MTDIEDMSINLLAFVNAQVGRFVFPPLFSFRHFVSSSYGRDLCRRTATVCVNRVYSTQKRAVGPGKLLTATASKRRQHMSGKNDNTTPDARN